MFEWLEAAQEYIWNNFAWAEKVKFGPREFFEQKNFLKVEKLLRDAQRIVKWRSFYLKTLHPLDVEAVKLIKENTHLYYQVC